MTQKYNIVVAGIAIAAMLTLSTTSCKRDVFDADDYNELIRVQSPVDSIESTHSFKTTERRTIQVEVNGPVGTRRVQVLSANPVVEEACYILAEAYATDGQRVTLPFTAPISSSVFYAALVSDDGRYTVTRFYASQSTVDFSHPEALSVMLARTPVPQVFTYCYEDEQPEAGDYDYNDLVLRISKVRTGEKELSLNVTVAAVGSSDKLAAAIRFVGITTDQIDSVYTEGVKLGETFDDDYTLVGEPYIENPDQIHSSLKGEAVLRLFEDAHWATGDPNLEVVNSVIDRYHYNVARVASDIDELISPRTITFHIAFKNAQDLDVFAMDVLDLFVMKEYNGAVWEVHIGDYQSEQVLHEYSLVTTIKLLPWALAIPSGSFRYPLQGYNIGYRKNGYLFGAYMTSGHSFGEWVENHLQSTDWYEYPTLNMVF